jgi:hypothetical protein
VRCGNRCPGTFDTYPLGTFQVILCTTRSYSRHGMISLFVLVLVFEIRSLNERPAMSGGARLRICPLRHSQYLFLSVHFRWAGVFDKSKYAHVPMYLQRS